MTDDEESEVPRPVRRDAAGGEDLFGPGQQLVVVNPTGPDVFVATQAVYEFPQGWAFIGNPSRGVTCGNGFEAEAVNGRDVCARRGRQRTYLWSLAHHRKTSLNAVPSSRATGCCR